MKEGPATVRVLVDVAVLVQTGERRRIGHPLVEIADLVGGRLILPLALRCLVHVDIPSIFVR